MTPVAQRQPAAPSFEPSESVPIAHLSPSSAGPASYIQAKVALVWPYSSSTDSLALLLAEPDVRLRKQKGQVKVVFRNGCAREIAKTQVGIGDTIDLALVGCEWKDTGEVVSTPGKKIDWDLQFHDRVVFQVVRDQTERATVNYTRNASNPPPIEDATTPSASLQASRPQVNGILRHEPSTIQVHLTPFKSTRQYSGGNLLDVSLGPFAEDDGYVSGKGRKRTKFARHSGAWSLVDPEDTGEPSLGLQTNLNDAEPTLPDLSPENAEIDRISDRSPRPGNEEEQTNEPDIVSKDATPLAPAGQAPGREVEGSLSPPLSSGAIRQHITTTAAVMGPPQTPLRARQLEIISDTTIGNQNPSEEQFNEASTPRLLPLPSPGLPLVSPLIQRSGVELGYFPLPEEPTSQLEASGEGRGLLALGQDDTVGIDHATTEPGDMTSVSEDSSVQRQASNAKLMEAQGTNELLEDRKNYKNTPEEDFEFKSGTSNMDSIQNGAPLVQLKPPKEANDGQALASSEKSSTHQALGEPNTELVEIEDDDLYGAPEANSRSSVSVANLTSLAQSQGSADTVPQSLQMSPTTTVSPTTTGSRSGTSQSPALQQSPLPDPSNVTWHEKMTVGAVECQSPATYPEPPFPFRQHWHKSIGSSSSSRRSSHDSKAQSLDGNIDEGGSPPLHPSQVRENALNLLKDSGAGRIEVQIVESDDNTSQMPGDSPETVETESSNESVTTSDDEDRDVAPYVGNMVGISPELDSMHRQELPGELPTPDQTQQDRVAIDHALAKNSVNEQLPVPNQPLSPQPTQEETTSVDLQEEVQLQVMDKTATSDAESWPGQMTLRRSSQRLSVKKSVVSANISSPYFTPRRVTPEVSSPLSRKENVKSLKPGIGRLSSPPTHEASKSVISPIISNEADQEGMNMTLSEEANWAGAGAVLQLRKGITTSLSYYPRLISLQEHFGDLLDVIAICVDKSSEPEQSKSGPKDYFTTLRLADPSLHSEDVATVLQVFRPVKSALPITERGDAILIRDVKVQTLNRQFMLLSTETSSWAVLKVSNQAKSPQLDAVVAGPPIEYGQGEALYVETLHRWWANDGEVQFPDRTTSVRGNVWDESSPQGSPALEQTKEIVHSHSWAIPASRRKGNFTDNANNEGDADEVVVEDDLDESAPLADMTNRRRESTVSTARSTTKDPGKEGTPRRSTRSQASPNLVHELRDGTKYVDRDRDRRRSGSVIHELRDGATYVDD